MRTAVNFLHYATSNKEKIFDNKKILVIGGGNVAVDCARTAHRLGAIDTKLISLENRQDMPASNEEKEETLAENIDILNSYGPKEILVDDNNNVKGIVLKKCVSTIDDETHKFKDRKSTRLNSSHL